ncbi:MAG: beta-lactamase regulating signal transducer with metallopeptidase domain [Chlamydiales bacterium]|jgi:beta-lactamase regulating signal transducer with metallopeptidase domain
MSSSFIEGTLLSWLITYAVHSTLLLSAAWLVFSRTSLGSLRAREVVWKSVLLGGIVTATLQSTVAPTPLGGRWVLPSTSAPLEAELISAAGTHVASYHATPIAHHDAELFTEVDAPVPQTTSVHDAFSGTNGTGATSPILPQSTATTGIADWGRWSLIAWACIGALCLLAFALSWRRLGRFLAGKRRIHEGSLPGLLAMLRRQGGVRRHVRLYTCPGLSSPLAMGAVFPKICLPERINSLPRDMQESILAHELAHIARFDPLWLIVARALEVVFFFQPLNRVARRHIQQSAELLCDDWAIERTARPIVLARSLAEVAGWLIGEPAQLACAMVAQSSALGERVSRLLNERKPEARSTWALPASSLLLGATVMLAPGFADQGRPIDDDPLHDSATLLLQAQPHHLATSNADENVPLAQEGMNSTLVRLSVELSMEMSDLTRSIDELRSRSEDKQLTPSLAARIDALEQRSQDLLDRKERMEHLIASWQFVTAPRAQATLTTPEMSR